MKQIIILVAMIALGIFIAGQLDDFKEPVEKNISSAISVMNENVPKSE